MSAVECERVLFIPDCHIPFHDKKAFGLMLRVAAEVNFDRVVLLGDFADFFQVSFHERQLTPRPSFATEVNEVNRALDAVENACPNATRHYVFGNHEFRFDRWLANKAPELANLPGLSVREMLRLTERGWRITKYRDHLRIGKLWVTHDEGASGPLAAITARATYNGCVVIGHCHAMTVSYKGDARGKGQVGASFGWLGNIDTLDYMHRVRSARWVHGFGVGLLEPNGVVHLQAIPIVGGKCAVFGSLFK